MFCCKAGLEQITSLNYFMHFVSDYQLNIAPNWKDKYVGDAELPEITYCSTLEVWEKICVSSTTR